MDGTRAPLPTSLPRRSRSESQISVNQAAGVGFEPTNEVTPVAGFQDSRESSGERGFLGVWASARASAASLTGSAFASALTGGFGGQSSRWG